MKNININININMINGMLYASIRRMLGNDWLRSVFNKRAYNCQKNIIKIMICFSSIYANAGAIPESIIGNWHGFDGKITQSSMNESVGVAFSPKATFSIDENGNIKGVYDKSECHIWGKIFSDKSGKLNTIETGIHFPMKLEIAQCGDWQIHLNGIFSGSLTKVYNHLFINLVQINSDIGFEDVIYGALSRE